MSFQVGLEKYVFAMKELRRMFCLGALNWRWDYPEFLDWFKSRNVAEPRNLVMTSAFTEKLSAHSESIFSLVILPDMETVINVWLFRYLFHMKGPMVSLWRCAILWQGNAFEWNNEGNNPACSQVNSLSSARGFLPNTNMEFNKWRKWSYLLAYSPSARGFLVFLVTLLRPFYR